MTTTQYFTLARMALVHFALMYALMYAMVYVFADVYLNINQFYMAGIMTAPMILLELIFMRSMYMNTKVNALIALGSIALFGTFFLLMRNQTGVGDVEFLKSMIPHHSGAILMCERAALTDPALQELCRGIIIGQQAEINQMRTKLEELGS